MLQYFMNTYYSKICSLASQEKFGGAISGREPVPGCSVIVKKENTTCAQREALQWCQFVALQTNFKVTGKVIVLIFNVMAYLVYVSFLLTCVCVIGSNARSSLSMTSLKHSPPSRISKVNLVPSIGTSIGSNKRNSIYKNHLPEITETANTLVVGGGLCGMAAAYYALKDKKDSWDGKQAPEKMQYEVLLCDAKNRMGGNINTQQSMYLWILCSFMDCV